MIVDDRIANVFELAKYLLVAVFIRFFGHEVSIVFRLSIAFDRANTCQYLLSPSYSWSPKAFT